MILEDCRVPVDNLLGGMEKLERKLERARSGESSGRASNALATFELTRPIVGASALGIAQAAYEWTLSYLDNGGFRRSHRRVSGRELDRRTPAAASARQSSSGSRTWRPRSRPARLLVQRAAWMGRNGIPMTGGQGSMSKLKGGDVAMWATRTCMDLVGPHAQTVDCPLEKWFRDAKIYQLFEGTAEIQRLVISRMQAAEYRERLANGAAIAADAMATATAASGNGSGPNGEHPQATESQNGAGRAEKPAASPA